VPEFYIAPASEGSGLLLLTWPDRRCAVCYHFRLVRDKDAFAVRLLASDGLYAGGRHSRPSLSLEKPRAWLARLVGPSIDIRLLLCPFLTWLVRDSRRHVATQYQFLNFFLI
jgi:hypothetical protein